MADTANQSIQIKRALVQKLESLHSSGVRTIPRTNMESTSAPAAASDSPVAAPAQVASPAKVAPTAPTTESPAKPAPSVALPRTTPAPAALPPDQGTPEPFSTALLPAQDRPPALEILANEVSECTRCPELVKSRKQTVFGVGNPNSRLVFFGEAPGADEDRMGEPFVGKAGQLLTKIIEACTLKRDDVYIMNVLRCRPPGNRNPAPDEAQNCRPFFEKQFEIIRPEFICCLGSIAATTLLNTTVSVGRLRGKIHDWRGMKVVVTYHPAYLLRNASAKKHVWADMKMLMNEMGVEL